MTDDRSSDGKAYQLAVAVDAASQIDLDAAMALAKSAVRAVASIGPKHRVKIYTFALEGVARLERECTEEGQGSIALILDGVFPRGV